ncbi:MAG: amidohydrolase [SAR324 cluster bacterium]|nr:amidohydrolase [SAR324 cluster bacterium]
MEGLNKRIDELFQEMVELRRDIHMHPELGFQESRTAALIEGYLKDLNIDTKRLAKTGVVGIIRGQRANPVLMLRADMDALPLTEVNDHTYKSVNKGVMHACGHDGHVAMLLTAAKILSENCESLQGTVKLVFQPDEEQAGAVAMIEDGVLEDPRVEAVFGIHLWSYLKSGRIGISSGPIMAGLDVVNIRIIGKGGHTGAPENSIDPILTAANVIQTVQSLQTREISNLKSTVIVFGKIQGGTKGSIIPDEVELEGTIRFLYPGGRDSEEQPTKRLIRIVEGVCATHRCTCRISVERENIPTINDSRMADLARETSLEVFGSQHAVMENRSLASEDFSEYSARVPGVLVFLGTANEEKGSQFPHHSSRFDIDEETMREGVGMHVRFALNYFNQATKQE